jgi:hypothetical protein
VFVNPTTDFKEALLHALVSVGFIGVHIKWQARTHYGIMMDSMVRFINTSTRTDLTRLIQD